MVECYGMRYGLPLREGIRVQNRVLVVLAIVAVTGAAAGAKVTVDPNPVHAAAAKHDEKPDARLDRKVTYDGGYGRLHAVTDALTKATGVTIRCGKNPQDWQIRDIPVVVCVRDMPLRKLLNTLATATHTELLPEKHAGEKTVYRVCRTRTSEDEMKKLLASHEIAARAVVRWAWDTLASLPSVEKEKPDPYTADERMMSRIVTALGADTRDKLLGGEAMTIRAKDVLPAPLIQDIVPCQTAELLALPDAFYKPEAVTQDDINHVTLVAKFVKPTESSMPDNALWLTVGNIPIQMKMNWPGMPHVAQEFGPVTRDWIHSPVELAKAIAARDSKVSAPPDKGAVLKTEDAPPDAELAALKDDKDWDQPMLQAKVKLEFAKDKAIVCQSDVLTELAKSSAINIVSEDFVSHRHDCRYPPSANLGATVKDVLKKLNDRYYDSEKANWFASKDEKLLVGWACGWPWRHTNLAPESIISSIHEKCSGPGAELDDVVPVFRLTEGQFNEWVVGGCDLPGVAFNMQGIEQGLWQLYDALSPDDKAAARSRAGLGLAKFDANWIAGILREKDKEFWEHAIKDQMDEDMADVFKRPYEMLSDMDFVGNSVMRVKSVPLDAWRTFSLVPGTAELRQDFKVYRPGPNGVKKHYYEIELSGRKNGADAQFVSKWGFMPVSGIYAGEGSRAASASARPVAGTFTVLR